MHSAKFELYFAVHGSYYQWTHMNCNNLYHLFHLEYCYDPVHGPRPRPRPLVVGRDENVLKLAETFICWVNDCSSFKKKSWLKSIPRRSTKETGVTRANRSDEWSIFWTKTIQHIKNKIFVINFPSCCSKLIRDWFYFNKVFRHWERALFLMLQLLFELHNMNSWCIAVSSLQRSPCIIRIINSNNLWKNWIT